LTNTLPIDALKRSLEIWAGKPDPLVNAYALNPHIPPAVSNALHMAMDIEHGKRFASAKEMQTALREAFKTEQMREEEAKRAALLADQQKIESERASILQERRRMEAEREKYISQIEARNRQTQDEIKPTDAATVQMNQGDLNIPKNDPVVPKTEIFTPPPASPFPTPNQATNHPSVETIAAPAKFAVDIENKTRLPETNSPASPMTQGNFMPQTFADKPKKKSNKLLWLIPVFGLLFLMLGGAGFGFWLWQKNRTTTTTTNTNTTVNTNTANTTNTKTLAETNSESSEPDTPSEQGDLTGDTDTEVKTTEVTKPVDTKPKPEPPKKTTTTTVATRPTPKPVVRTTPSRRTEGASSINRKQEGAAPRP
jgi:hypothetical protein